MNSKYIAGISLAIMGAGFIITYFLPQNIAIILLHGGFEAGLVGGFADWFAVTALFRHPMGIPIPHTSLLLKNKDRIVESMISSMENELLNKQSIEAKLREVQLLQRGTSMLTKALSRKSNRIRVLNTIIVWMRKQTLEPFVPMVQSGLTAYIQKAELKGAADAIVTKLVRERYDEQALDYVLKEAEDWLQQRQTKLMLGKLASDKLADVRMGGFTGFAVQAFAGFMDEDKLGGMLQSMILSAVRDLQESDNSQREAIIREIRVRLFGVVESEEHMETLKSWLLQQVQAENASTLIQSQLEQLRELMIAKLEEDRSSGGHTVFKAYRFMIRKVSEDMEQVAAWEQRALDAIVRVVEANHYRIGQLVRDNVKKMDDAALVQMLEEKIGKDLQWIRVNGALCGFIIGVLLALIKLI